MDLREFFNTAPKPKHTSLNILKYVKNSFLLSSVLKIETSHNKEAGENFNKDYEKLKESVKQCVEKS